MLRSPRARFATVGAATVGTATIGTAMIGTAMIGAATVGAAGRFATTRHEVRRAGAPRPPPRRSDRTSRALDAWHALALTGHSVRVSSLLALQLALTLATSDAVRSLHASPRDHLAPTPPATRQPETWRARGHAWGSGARVDRPLVESVAPGFASKKERWLAGKAERAERAEATSGGPRRAALPRPGTKAPAPVFAQNVRTREIAVLEGPGALSPERADRFFRCWFTGDHVDIPDVLVARVVQTARTFGVRHVKVVSSYRAPKYNLSLVKKGREVARDSEHTRGQAIDFQLVGVPVLAVYEHLLATHAGGVGYYPVSEFVHVDIGRKRTWQGT